MEGGKKSLKLISSLTTMPTSHFTDAMQEFLRQFTRFFLVRLQRTEKKGFAFLTTPLLKLCFYFPEAQLLINVTRGIY